MTAATAASEPKVNLSRIIIRLWIYVARRQLGNVDFASHLRSFDDLLLDPTLSSVVVHMHITVSISALSPQLWTNGQLEPLGSGAAAAAAADEEVRDGLMPFLDEYFRGRMAGLDSQGRLDLSIVRRNFYRPSVLAKRAQVREADRVVC
jgi:hypothetical protein